MTNADDFMDPRVEELASQLLDKGADLNLRARVLDLAAKWDAMAGPCRHSSEEATLGACAAELQRVALHGQRVALHGQRLPAAAPHPSRDPRFYVTAPELDRPAKLDREPPMLPYTPLPGFVDGDDS